MMDKPKTYKEALERVCDEYAEFKVYTNIKIYALVVLIIVLSIVIFLLVIFINS